MLHWLLIGILFIFLLGSCDEKKTITEHNLPQIHLTCIEEDLNLSDYLISDIEWLDSNGVLIWESKAHLRFRGNRSAAFDKHSYNIKLNENTSILDMAPNKKWKLNAEYIDKTLMRNKLSYDLFRSFSQGNVAPQIEFCVVYRNGSYEGIYALTESVDAHFLDLNSGAEGGLLFKEPPISNPPEEHAERHQNFINYIEHSVRYKDYSIKAKYKLLDECYFNQRHPEVREKNCSQEIFRVTEFIFNSSDVTFSDPTVFNAYFDLNNLIDFHLLILVTANGDGTYKNYYMSRQSDKAPYLFTPWDYDHSFGRDGDGEPSKVQLVSVKKNMALLHRLMETNAFDYRTRLYRKFLDLKKKGILTDKHIHKMIDANVAQLGSEIRANESRWPLEKIDYFKNARFETEVQRMKNWITNHLPELERYLKEESIYWKDEASSNSKISEYVSEHLIREIKHFRAWVAEKP
jgi:spore coat protein H